MHPQTSLIIAHFRKESIPEATSTRMSEAQFREWGRYASSPCTSMLGEDVSNRKQSRDIVK